MGAVRMLIESRAFEIDVQPTGTEIGCPAVQEMAPSELPTILRNATPLDASKERLTKRTNGSVSRECGAAARVSPDLQQPARPLITCVMPDHVDHTDKAGGSIRHRRRAPHHFDPVDIDEVEQSNGRIEGTPQRNSIDDQHIRI